MKIVNSWSRWQCRDRSQTHHAGGSRLGPTQVAFSIKTRAQSGKEHVNYA